MLSSQIDVERLGFRDTSELPPLEGPLGQERAIEALEFGLRMASPGFNVFVSGPVGAGKWAIVRPMVERLASSLPMPPDLCYVNNFQNPSQPRYLLFPHAQGRRFKEGMATLIQALQRDIPSAFESTKYLEARAKITEETEEKKKSLFKQVAEVAQKQGFGFKEEPVGFSVVPLRESRPMTDEELSALTDAEQDQLTERRKVLESKLREFQSRLHTLDHEAEHRLHEMDRQVTRTVMFSRFVVLKEYYKDRSDVLDYLGRVEEDIVSNYKSFRPREAPPFHIPGLEVGTKQTDLSKYQVNLVVEHEANHGAPVVEESHPTYANLIGKIERKVHMGVVYTDFTEINAGALLQANGGFLILNVMDLLRQPFAWDALKRVIKTREVKIEDPGEFFGFSTTALKPQPIPADVKVILLGPPVIFRLLQLYEEDFQKMFKVKADLDEDVPRDDHLDQLYARYVSTLCRDEQLLHFSADAVAEIIRQGLRLAERRDRVSLRLSLLADVIREAGFWAHRAGRSLVSREDVETAIAKKRYRANLPEEWIQDEIKEGTLMVDLEGEEIGQVNGLSVHLLGDYTFGRPCRITARTFVGTKGVIDIQRESELAGHVHSKGVLTLAGYLAGQFAGTHPFALNATLTFEQTYSEVEGDSASVAELAAILSSLAQVPIRQSLAVTGSINQLGEVQPIGGVNEKIEGFFEACRKRGLTGEQGVIIPARNIKHLSLRQDVVESVGAGKFAVYAVDSVEEALELLTGLPCGERNEMGHYPEGTLYHRVVERLAKLARLALSWKERSLEKTSFSGSESS